MLDTTPHPALTQCPRCKGMGVVPLTYRVKAPTAAPPKRTAKMDFSFLHKRWVKYLCFFVAFLFLSALHQTSQQAKDAEAQAAYEATPAGKAANEAAVCRAGLRAWERSIGITSDLPVYAEDEQQRRYGVCGEKHQSAMEDRPRTEAERRAAVERRD
jgi:hypothetical protein